MHDKKKILYLGLDPKKNVFHYPIIKIVPRPQAEIEVHFREETKWTHVLFTSKQSVSIFFNYAKCKNYVYFAVGEATKAKILEYGDFKVQTASLQCGEGILPLLKDFQGHLFYPHSSRSRPLILDFLKENNITHTESVFYDTIFNFIEPKPCLKDFDEIVFTSPSTVEAFCELYGGLPMNKSLKAIGEITARAIEKKKISC